MKDPTIQIEIPTDALLEFTQSELAEWDKCAFSWYLRYAHRLSLSNSYSMALIIGDGLHSTLAEWYRNKKLKITTLRWPEGVVPTLEDEKKLEEAQVLVNAMSMAYAEWYKDDLKTFKIGEGQVEQVITVEIEYKGVPIKLKGTLDRIIGTKSQQIMDHKSTGLLNSAVKDAWQFKFQFGFYEWLAFNSPTFRQSVPAEFMVNAIKKTQLRQKQDESLPAFENRIYRDMLERPAEYFWREAMKFNANSMKRFEEEHLNPKLDRIVAILSDTSDPRRAAMKPFFNFLGINKNTDACWNYNRPCQFLPICSGTFAENVERYTKRKVKHTNYTPESYE